MAISSLNTVEDFIDGLVAMGYEHMPDRYFEDRYFFPKGRRNKRTHHLNLVEIDSPTAWTNPLLFRNYLLKNPGKKEEYNKLKQDLAAKNPNDREKYTGAKSDFVLGILSKASAE